MIQPHFKRWLLAVAGSGVFTAGCRSHNEEPEGGFCSYKDTAIPAKVVNIERVSPTQYDLTFKLDSNIFKPVPGDTVHFHSENGYFLDKAVFDSLGVDTGKVYIFLVREIVEGSCNPFLTELVMKEVVH